jgi:hypothetical protein
MVPKSQLIGKIKELSSLDILPFLESGNINISINNFPLLKIDCKTKVLEVEIRGVHESGIKLFHIMRTNNRLLTVLRIIREFAASLSDRKWKLTIYDMGSPVLNMGSGVSSLTGHIGASPLRLRTIIKDLLL